MDHSDRGAAQRRAPRDRRQPSAEIVSLTVERVRVEPRSYKFVRSVQEDAGDGFLASAAEEKAMRADAPISLGWPGHQPHPQTRFRYEPNRR